MNEQSRGDNPRAAVASDGHTHGADPAEARMVTDLMAILGVSCSGLGSHTHPVEENDGHGRVRRLSRPHHHHDLRCLVEAGANQVRPRLDAAETRADSFAAQIKVRGKVILEQAQQIERLEGVNRALTDDAASVGAFLRAMPAVGPWKTLAEQYHSWVEEEESQAQQATG